MVKSKSLVVQIHQSLLKKNDEVQLTFEYIDMKEKLILSLFFKTLIKFDSNDNIEKYTKFLYNKYSNKNLEIYKLFEPILSMTNIPIEILSKYYARLFTSESDFYLDLNKDLGLNKIQDYLLFVKILYEGVKLKSLPLASNNILYRGSKISNEEITKIKDYMAKKIDNLPCSIVFSRSFLSFSKDKSIAEYFLKFKNENKNLSKVLFVVIKDDNYGYNLATHGDIEEISFHLYEKEVLFFPFSSFEIKGIKEIDMKIGKNYEKIYEIKLLYLGKYLKDLEDDDLINNENPLPESEFENQLFMSGLIGRGIIKNINFKKLFIAYKEYEKAIKEKNNYRNNKILGIINIESEDINKDILIINSFENFKRIEESENEEEGEEEENKENENEEQIKENIQIKINKKIIDFSYYHKFEKVGKYEIEYSFKSNLTNINYMFYNCLNLTSLNLSKFKTENINNMKSIFDGCESLLNINLSNMDTKNANDMSYMFNDCKSLKSLDLSNFNTKNANDMSNMFNSCFSLTKLDLSNFNTENVNDMCKMFYFSIL